MNTKQVSLWICALFYCSTALAGTQAVMQNVNLDNGANGKQNGNTVISVEGNLIRFTHSSNSDSDTIFDSDKKEMIIIDHEEKTFMRMDQLYFKKIEQAMLNARKQMEDQMAQMPAEQREMMKQMMGDKIKMFDKPAKKQVEFNKTNRKGSAAGYDCLITESFVNGIKTNEYCVTETKKIEGAQTIYDSMLSISELFKGFYESMSENFAMQTEANPFTEMSKLNGFPIKVTTYTNGKVTEQTELKSIETKAFENGYFSPPKGYKERKADDLGF